MKYEFPLSSYTSVGAFALSGLAEGVVPPEIGKVVEIRIRVLGHNSANWIILSEVRTRLSLTDISLCNWRDNQSCKDKL